MNQIHYPSAQVDGKELAPKGDPVPAHHYLYKSTSEYLYLALPTPKTATAAAPDVKWDTEGKEILYTLAFVDPDAPGRAEPKFRNW